MSDELKDYEQHIKHTSERPEFKDKTWCGLSGARTMWCFTSLDHAVYSIMTEASVVPCPKCLFAATRAVVPYVEDITLDLVDAQARVIKQMKDNAILREEVNKKLKSEIEELRKPTKKRELN